MQSVHHEINTNFLNVLRNNFLTIALFILFPKSPVEVKISVTSTESNG